MSVAVVDYGSGNLRSAAKAFERALGEAGVERRVQITSDPDTVRRAGHIVLPGVGAFADCMAGLMGLDGMIEALEEAVLARGRPFLGICVGMQLMAGRGVEHGIHQGLGWIPGEVAALAPGDAALKIPHMGWNAFETVADHPVLTGIRPGAHAYFVHGFGFACEDPGHELAQVDYGGAVTAAIGRDSMLGTQFHPEKSQATGLRLIANFLAWRP
jgi:glutamine amidotransferase